MFKSESFTFVIKNVFLIIWFFPVAKLGFESYNPLRLGSSRLWFTYRHLVRFHAFPVSISVLRFDETNVIKFSFLKGKEIVCLR